MNIQSTSKTVEQTKSYSWGYRELDKLTGGIRPGELTLIGARPGMGKRSFAFNLISHLLDHSKSITYLFTDLYGNDRIEHPTFRLLRFLSGNVSSHKTKEDNWKDMSTVCAKLSESKFSCRGLPMLYDCLTHDGYKNEIDSIGDFNDIKKITYADRPDVLVLDGLQLVKYSDEDDSGTSIQYFDFWRKLKDLAKELFIPIIVFTKWPRCCEERDDKRPSLDDFNCIDANTDLFDTILFLYRDNYYLEEFTKTNIMEILVAKSPYTNGAMCKLLFDNDTCKIKELRADLHLHTIYSTKDDMMPVRDIAIKAKEMGLSAVAVVDHGNVQGFPDAELASKKYGIKIIYGMECDCIDDLSEDKTPFRITLLVKNKTGLKNLYQLISLSHMRNCCEEPPIPKSLLAKHRDGLLIGACCNDGEILNALVNGHDDEVLLTAAQFYDYFEIAPRKGLQRINLRVAQTAEKLGKPVIATSNARYLNQDYALSHKILRHCFKQLEDTNEWRHFRSTEEMLDNFSYLGEELCYKAVIANTQLLADICEEFDLFPNGRHFPDIKDSAENLTALCEEKIQQLYGKNPPAEVVDRLQAELDIILPNGYDGIYMLTRELALHSLTQGYPVGVRGCGGNSFVSFLLGITDFNPLPSHNRCSHCGYADFENNVDVCPICNQQMITDGFDLPYEAFLGLPEGSKVPDFDLGIPKSCWKSTEKLLIDMFGEDHVFYAGVVKGLYDSVARQMVRTYASDKNIPFSRNEIERLTEQLRGIRIKDDFHISGHVIIPTNMEVTDFCPIQHCNGRPTVMTQFEYHYMIDALYKADLFIDKNSDLLQAFAEDTGVDWQSIPLDDKETFELICSGDVDGIPELHTEYARRMVRNLQPTNFDDLVRIVCFGHDTDAWKDNAEVLIKNGIPLKDTISSREDVMLYLLDKGMDRKLAYRIMERVRKGQGLTPQYEESMRNLGVPDWYIDSCNKVRYLFPKAHCISSVLFAYRMAWYKAHFPEMYTNPIYVRL